MQEKAYVCVCVEGYTDKKALEGPISEIFDQKFGDSIDVFFRIPSDKPGGEQQGDLTSKPKVTPDNVEKNIYQYYFKKNDDESGLTWNDFTSIIQIIDTDGVYAPDDCVKEFTAEEENSADALSTSSKQKRILYLEDHLAVRGTIDSIIERNRHKRKNIEYLISKDTIQANPKQAPKNYSIYYFSSNLDHFLCGDANLPSNQKDWKVAEFKKKHTSIDEFIQYFKNNQTCQETDYLRSWQYLRKGCNSLQRGTNLNILFDRVQNSTLDDWM